MSEEDTVMVRQSKIVVTVEIQRTTIEVGQEWQKLTDDSSVSPQYRYVDCAEEKDRKHQLFRQELDIEHSDTGKAAVRAIAAVLNGLELAP